MTTLSVHTEIIFMSHQFPSMYGIEIPLSVDVKSKCTFCSGHIHLTELIVHILNGIFGNNYGNCTWRWEFYMDG